MLGSSIILFQPFEVIMVAHGLCQREGKREGNIWTHPPRFLTHTEWEWRLLNGEEGIQGLKIVLINKAIRFCKLVVLLSYIQSN